MNHSRTIGRRAPTGTAIPRSRADAAPCYGAAPRVGVNAGANGNDLPVEILKCEAPDCVRRSALFQNGPHARRFCPQEILGSHRRTDETINERRYCRKQTVAIARARRELVLDAFNDKSSQRRLVPASSSRLARITPKLSSTTPSRRCHRRDEGMAARAFAADRCKSVAVGDAFAPAPTPHRSRSPEHVAARRADRCPPRIKSGTGLRRDPR